MPKNILPQRREMSLRARDLRRKATAGEEMLWKLLRDRRLKGVKFRRQFPIGHFVAHFCCYELRLVVALDGRVHEDARQRAHDEHRDCYLRPTTYIVLRFPNDQVFDEPERVLEAVFQAAWTAGWVPPAEK